MMRKIFRLRVLGVLIIILIFAYTIITQEIKMREQAEAIEKLKVEDQELTKKCLRYEDKKKGGEEDRDTRQFREDLKYKKPGEIVVIDKNQGKTD